MFTELQVEIIHAVSTVLFQEVIYNRKPLTRAYKRETNTYEEHQKGHYFIFEKNDAGEPIGKYKYCLYVININDQECLALDEFEYDEYGACDDIHTLGYVVLGKPERDHWEMHRYCVAVERILENGC